MRKFNADTVVPQRATNAIVYPFWVDETRRRTGVWECKTWIWSDDGAEEWRARVVLFVVFAINQKFH